MPNTPTQSTAPIAPPVDTPQIDAPVATSQPPINVTVQMPDTRAAGPTEGLSETRPGGLTIVNGKTLDAFGLPIKD